MTTEQNENRTENINVTVITAQGPIETAKNDKRWHWPGAC